MLGLPSAWYPSNRTSHNMSTQRRSSSTLATLVAVLAAVGPLAQVAAAPYPLVRRSSQENATSTALGDAAPAEVTHIPHFVGWRLTIPAAA